MPKSKTPLLYSRADWISFCEFHDLADADVLSAVTGRVRATIEASDGSASTLPVLLFDLDSTLYDPSPRTHTIVREWLGEHRGTLAPHVSSAMEKLEEQHVSYSLRDLFSALGLNPDEPAVEAAWKHAKTYWQSRFFSNEYLGYDRPYEGSAEFVSMLHSMGATIVYLTGRDSPGMAMGTLANLRRDDFPVDVPRTFLMMKAAREGDDYAHKVGVADRIRDLGILAASFENEPRNLMGLFEAFPEAIHVFVETVCSDSPAPLGKGLYRLKGFPKCR